MNMSAEQIDKIIRTGLIIMNVLFYSGLIAWAIYGFIDLRKGRRK